MVGGEVLGGVRRVGGSQPRRASSPGAGRRADRATPAAVSPSRAPSRPARGRGGASSTVATQGDSGSGDGRVEALVSPEQAARAAMPAAAGSRAAALRLSCRPPARGRRHRHVLGGRLRRRQLFGLAPYREPVVNKEVGQLAPAVRDRPWRSCGWSRRPAAPAERRGPSVEALPARQALRRSQPVVAREAGSALEWLTDDEDHAGARDERLALRWDASHATIQRCGVSVWSAWTSFADMPTSGIEGRAVHQLYA